MVNPSDWRVKKKPLGLFYFLVLDDRHFRHQLWLVAPEGTVLKPNKTESSFAVFALVMLQLGQV